MRRMLSSVSVAVLALLLLGPLQAQAGGWVVVTLDSLPDGAAAGQELTIGLMVRQHGRTPIAGQDARLELTHQGTGEQLTVRAQDEGLAGHYAARLYLTRPGTWVWQVNVWGMHPMPPLDVGPSLGHDSGGAVTSLGQNVGNREPLATPAAWLLLAIAMVGATTALVWSNRAAREPIGPATK